MMGGREEAWAISFFRNLYYDGVVVFLVFSATFCHGFFIAMLWVVFVILTPLVAVLCCVVLWRVYRISCLGWS